MEWYNALNKPFLNPHAEIFLPVWTILYITIFASFIIFIKDGINKEKILPLILFSFQMILNFSWSNVFFNMQNIKAALVILVFMWVFILLTIITFYKHSKLSAILLFPYFLWVTFAFYLNFEYLRLNFPQRILSVLY